MLWLEHTASGRPREIQWTPFSYLEDFDFADYMAAISPKQTHLQEKSNRQRKPHKQGNGAKNDIKVRLNNKRSSFAHMLDFALSEDPSNTASKLTSGLTKAM